MCFKPRAWMRLLLAILGLWLGPSTAAEQPWQLKATPSQCVALEPDRVCYADINIQWYATDAHQVCLKIDDRVLQCWTQTNQAQWTYELAAKQSQQLALVVDGQEVIQMSLQVSYVQKANRLKRRWRLF